MARMAQSLSRMTARGEMLSGPRPVVIGKELAPRRMAQGVSTSSGSRSTSWVHAGSRYCASSCHSAAQDCASRSTAA